MPSGPPICALRASGRRIFGKGCFGWVTPAARDHKDAGHRDRPKGEMLDGQARLAGWRTPNATDSDHGGPNARDSSGSPHLTMQAQLAGWPTPRTITGGPESAERKQELGRTASGGGDLQAVVQMAGWPTPNAMEGGQSSRSGDRKGEPLMGGIIRGLQASSSPAPTAKPEGGRLNPLFSLWLQGYPPAEWASCAVRATQSCRK